MLAHSYENTQVLTYDEDEDLLVIYIKIDLICWKEQRNLVEEIYHY